MARNLKLKRYNIYDVIIIAILVILSIITLYPFVFTIAGSFSNGIQYDFGGVWLIPRMPTLANYQVVLSDSRFYWSLLRTVAVTVIGSLVALIFTSCVSYGMSHPKLKFRNFFWKFYLVTMFFSGGMIPSYLLMKTIGLYNTFWVYIIPSMFSVYNTIIISNFFKSLDAGLRESACIDGAGEFRIWFSIYMPLSKPVLATVLLWLAVGKWNGFMSTLLYTDTTSTDLWLLPFYMMRIVKFTDVPEVAPELVNEVSGKTIEYASIIVSSLPILLFYPFIAKFFSKGIMVGSVKG